MTKKELEQLRPLKAEIKVLQDEIHNLPVIMDSVIGSSPEYPWTARRVLIRGIDTKLRVELVNRLNRKLDNLQESIERMEGWLDSVEDSEMRTILRLYYCDGMTQQEIAGELNYTRGAIAKKIERIFKNG